MTRTMTRLSKLLVAACMLSSAAYAAGTPEQQCQAGRYNAAGRYVFCEQRAQARYYGTTGVLSTFDAAASKCRVKYAATWRKLQREASGTGATCDNMRFADRGDGTVFDLLTGLQWEKKTDDSTIHDKDNAYTWSAGGQGITAADGGAFTDFLAMLNSGGCFAGQCDWRLPTLEELQTILLESCMISGPCIDESVFGPVGGYYWSATNYVSDPSIAWVVQFISNGSVALTPKDGASSVRAVRFATLFPPQP